MRKAVAAMAAILLVAVVSGLVQSAEKKVPPVLNFKMKKLDGQEVNLADYHGKVVLFVNVASKCGLTPQYEGLQALHAELEDQGFRVLGFPANNFGGQEPGSNDDEIAGFSATTYMVGIPLFSKINVVGDDEHRLYAELTT